MKSHVVIAIGRQYGSGGREIAEKLAKSLGIACYHDELITMAAKESGMDEGVLSGVDETAANSLLYTLAMGSSHDMGYTDLSYHMPINDRLFITQSEIIRRLADEAPAVFIGRCADYVLREHPNLIKIFLLAPLDVRAAHIAERHQISLDKAKDRIVKTDKRRANYYQNYTGLRWGRADGFDLTVDTGKLGIDGTVEMLTDYVKRRMNQTETNR